MQAGPKPGAYPPVARNRHRIGINVTLWCRNALLISQPGATQKARTTVPGP